MLTPTDVLNLRIAVRELIGVVRQTEAALQAIADELDRYSDDRDTEPPLELSPADLVASD